MLKFEKINQNRAVFFIRMWLSTTMFAKFQI